MDQGAKSFAEMAEYDSRIYDLRKKLRAFPRRLEEARKQLVAEEALLKEVEDPWNDLEHRILEKEATIQVALETIEKFEEHIKRVTTQKEYMAAKKQVEEARRLNTQLQDEILEARVKQEELAPTLKEVRERHAKVQATYLEIEGEILKEQGTLESQVDGLESELKVLVETLGDGTWAYYQRLVHGGKAPGIVPVTGGTCGGCNMTIPPQSYNLVIAQPERVHTCSHCARIIYYKAPEPVPGDSAASAEPAEAASGS